MNRRSVIGIDYAQCHTVMVVAEGMATELGVRTVSDSGADMIPNLVDHSHRWGSAALQEMSLESLVDSARLDKTDAWSGNKATLFWQALYQHLYYYLGRTAPTRAHAYQVVVATSHDTSDRLLPALWTAGGFPADEPVRISQNEALLYRWLSDSAPAEDESLPVITIVVGGTEASVVGYRCQHYANDPMTLYVQDMTVSHSIRRTGYFWWLRELWDALADHQGYDLKHSQQLVVMEYAMDFARRFSALNRNASIRWQAPMMSDALMPDHLYDISYQMCQEWTSVIALTSALQSAVQTAQTQLRTLKGHLVIGGIGSVWPFAADCAKAALPGWQIWQSRNPTQDIAYGAARSVFYQKSEDRVRVSSGYLPLPVVPRPELPVSEPHDALSETSLSGEPSSLPPWMRPGLMDFEPKERFDDAGT